MLQRIEAKVGHVRRILVTVDPENATLVFELVAVVHVTDHAASGSK